MATDEADQSQAEQHLSQAFVGLNVSQAIPTDNAPPPLPTSLSPSLRSLPSAPIPSPLTSDISPFLRLPAELRNIIYGMLLIVDPHGSPIEHAREFCALPNTAMLYINKQVREEAMEVIRNQNTWVMVEVNSRDGDLDTLPYRELLSNQALIPRAWMGDLRLFLRSRSIVIKIVMAYGGRDIRPMQRHYTSVQFLLMYSRQGFTYLFLRFWQCAAINKDMTLILNMPHTSRDALIIRSIISELSHIRGLRHAACIGFPDVQQAQQLEQRMMSNRRTWKDLFEHLRWLREDAETAVANSMREEAIHRCRIACLTLNVRSTQRDVVLIQ
ncbi:hypothetical protein GJ744_012399 [Endocarpon pusillum]|uniref:Uncharacterized protein n=1 Tax=Endocarpon pusillum TaxID=364733 RepID=A0A8H7AF66_9EURO|nr:hypothetical protein GJ744_012399 [Endocarpon pusillum]